MPVRLSACQNEPIEEAVIADASSSKPISIWPRARRSVTARAVGSGGGGVPVAHRRIFARFRVSRNWSGIARVQRRDVEGFAVTVASRPMSSWKRLTGTPPSTYRLASRRSTISIRPSSLRHPFNTATVVPTIGGIHPPRLDTSRELTNYLLHGPKSSVVGAQIPEYSPRLLPSFGPFATLIGQASRRVRPRAAAGFQLEPRRTLDVTDLEMTATGPQSPNVLRSHSGQMPWVKVARSRS